MAPRNSFTRAIRAKAQPIWDRELKGKYVTLDTRIEKG